MVDTVSSYLASDEVEMQITNPHYKSSITEAGQRGTIVHRTKNSKVKANTVGKQEQKRCPGFVRWPPMQSEDDAFQMTKSFLPPKLSSIRLRKKCYIALIGESYCKALHC